MDYHREELGERGFTGKQRAWYFCFSAREEMNKRLLSFQDILARYRRGENLFDITIEKWTRIKGSLSSPEGMSELGAIIKCARSGGAFCLEYQDNCLICPLEKWCKDPEGTYQSIIKLLYLYTTSGQKEVKQQTLTYIEKFIEDLEEYKEEFRRRLH